jgi:hypothetical protein
LTEGSLLMKKRRRLAWVVGTSLLLLVLAVAGAWCYLHSAAGARLVARQLEKALGGRVSIARLRLGLERSVLEGLAVRDPADELWLTVERVSLDASLLDLARGRLPRRVELDRVCLDLHFAADGQLQTQLPTGDPAAAAASTAESAWPVVVVRASQLTLRQDGREPFVLVGIEATADPNHPDGSPQLTGTVTDPTWGQWTGQAHAQLDPLSGSLRLTTHGLRADMTMLRSVPFVPPEVWEQIELAGEADLTLTLSVEPDGAFSYRLAADLREAAAVIVPIDLRITHGRGSVLVASEVVTLDGLHGQTAGGRLDASGQLDFRRADQARLQFALTAQGLDLGQLPTTWKLPPELAGSLTGQASVEVLIAGERVSVCGQGEGAVQQASVLGVPAAGVRLRLTERPDGLRFEQPQPADGVPAPAGVNQLTADRPAAMSGSAPRRRQPPAPAVPEVGDAYLEVEATFPQLDVAELVKQLDLKLEVPLAGTGSASVTLGLPVAQADDLRTYHAAGQVQLSELSVGPVRLEQVRSQVRYGQGKLTLSDVTARWADAAPAAGAVVGHAEAQLVPLGRLHTHARCHDIALARLVELLGQPQVRAEGRLTAGASVEVPLDRLADPKAWAATAQVSAPVVQVESLRFESPTVQAKLASGIVSVTAATTRAADADVLVQGFLHLDHELRFDASWSAQGLDLERLARKLPDLSEALAPRGTLDLKGTLTGAMRPLTVGGTAEIATTRPLTLRRLPIRSLRAELDATPERLRVVLRGRTLDGSVQVESTVPLREALREAQPASPGDGAAGQSQTAGHCPRLAAWAGTRSPRRASQRQLPASASARRPVHRRWRIAAGAVDLGGQVARPRGAGLPEFRRHAASS